MPKLEKIKIGTFNLDNLALPDVDYYPKEHYSREVYEKKCQWTARQLDLMGADLVVFQEVFHKEALAHAISLRADGDSRTRIFVPEEGTGPKVCMATRYDVRECRWIPGIPPEVGQYFNTEGVPVGLDGKPIDQFSRPVLRARVALPDLGEGVEAIVFGTHLKSKSPDSMPDGLGGDLNNPIGQARSLIRRVVEAVGLRCLVLRDLVPRAAADALVPAAPPAPTPPVVLCGDCNDDTTAVTTQILCGDRYGGYKKLLRSAIDLHSSRSLYSSFYTYIFGGHYEVLDHILLSDHFAPGNDHRLGDVEYVRLFTDHLVDQELYRDAIPKFQSDHGQPVVTIKSRKKALEGAS